MSDYIQTKKMIAFYMLEILRQYSDANHKLTQAELSNILLTQYDVKVDRKTIKSNIMTLIELGYPIECEETSRQIKNKKNGEIEDTTLISGLWFVNTFSDSELRLLVDSLLFAPHISAKQSSELIEKMVSQSNKHFKPRVQHIATMSQNKSDNKQLFYTIDVVDEAISNGKKISFKYAEYDMNCKLQPKKDDSGKDRIYVVSPYQMAVCEDKYYLICNYDKYDDISNYRMDRILEAQIIDEKAKPFESLQVPMECHLICAII